MENNWAKRFFAIVVILVAFVVTPSSAQAENYFFWHYIYAQQGRNAAIINRAVQNLGQQVNGNCKEWARTVVREASWGEVIIPQTLPNADGWYWAYHPWIEEFSSTPIEAVVPGAILQTNWNTSRGMTPHTAIVMGVATDGIYLIESNWSAMNTVSQRFVSFVAFRDRVSQFTIHYIR